MVGRVMGSVGRVPGSNPSWHLTRERQYTHWRCVNSRLTVQLAKCTVPTLPSPVRVRLCHQLPISQRRGVKGLALYLLGRNGELYNYSNGQSSECSLQSSECDILVRTAAPQLTEVLAAPLRLWKTEPELELRHPAPRPNSFAISLPQSLIPQTP